MFAMWYRKQSYCTSVNMVERCGLNAVIVSVRELLQEVVVLLKIVKQLDLTGYLA
jgi:hypothetical protein